MLLNRNFDILQKLVNILIKQGKKEKALKIVLNLLKNIKLFEYKNYPNKDILYVAFNNVIPVLTLTKIKKSSKTFYCPKIITREKRINLSLHWLNKSLKVRKEKTLIERITAEINDCFFEKGLTITKKQSLYESILATRPFLNILIYKNKKKRDKN